MDRILDTIEEQILLERSRALARRTGAEDGLKESLPLLAFVLMGTRHAIALDKVDAVARIGEIISIPLTPKHIFGIIRRRGRSFTLVDLRHFFHPEDESLRDTDFAVFVTAQGKQFALQAEEIEGVIALDKKRLTPPPQNFDPRQFDFVLGVTTDGLTVLDLDTLVEADGFGMDSAMV